MPTIDDLELALPNGFHDAELGGIDINYERKEVVFTINVDVSETDTSGARKFRRGRLLVTGLIFISMDVPTSISTSATLWIGSGSGQPSTSPVPLPTLPAGSFLHWFFVNEWNAFIRLAAADAAFVWDV